MGHIRQEKQKSMNFSEASFRAKNNTAGGGDVGGRDEESQCNYNQVEDNKQQMLMDSSSKTTSGSGTTFTILSQSFLAFINLYRQIQASPLNRVRLDEKEVYKRLSDDLYYELKPHTFPWLQFSKLLLESLLLLSLTLCLVASLLSEPIKHREILHARYWRWVMLAMAVFSGLTITRLVTWVIACFILWWWKLHKYVAFFVHRIKRCVDFTLWFAMVLLIWYVWIRPKVMEVKQDLALVVKHQVTRFLIALILGSALWLCKNVLYLKLEADLHYNQLFERIRMSVVYLHGIQLIHNHGVWYFLSHSRPRRQDGECCRCQKETANVVQEKKHDNEAISRRFVKGMAVSEWTNSDHDQGGKDSNDHHHHHNRYDDHRCNSCGKKWKSSGKNIWMDVWLMKNETVPIWILQHLCEIYMKHIREKRAFWGKPNPLKDDVNLLKEAEDMLKLVTDGDHEREVITKKDLEKYGLTDAEKEQLFNMFARKNEEEEEEGGNMQKHQQDDGHDERVIERDQFLNWAVRAYKNCSSLERTLSSSKVVFIKLNRLLSTFIITVVLIIWLLLSGIVNSAQIALLFAPFVAVQFMFGDSCKKMFEGLIFAFAMHPFDVGDRVIIDNMQMKVNELNILTTVFYKYDTEESLVYPNSQLVTKNIVNLDTTPDQGDCLHFSIAEDTPLEDIRDLEIRIKMFIDEDRKFVSNSKVVKKEIMEGRLHMAVFFKYLLSYLPIDTKAMHKSNILTKIMEFYDQIKTKRDCTGDCSRLIVDEKIPFTIGNKPKLAQIDFIKQEIMKFLASGCKSKRYKEHSKVVMTELMSCGKEVKMAVILRRLEDDDKDYLRGDDDDDDGGGGVDDSELETVKSGIQNVINRTSFRTHPSLKQAASAVIRQESTAGVKL